MADPIITDSPYSVAEETVLDYINVRFKLTDKRAIRGAYGSEAGKMVSRSGGSEVGSNKSND